MELNLAVGKTVDPFCRVSNRMDPPQLFSSCEEVMFTVSPAKAGLVSTWMTAWTWEPS